MGRPSIRTCPPSRCNSTDIPPRETRMGNKIKKKKTDLRIGKLIVQAWKDAKDSAVDPFVINRKDLIDKLVNGNFIDTSPNTGGNNKRIVIDVVFDSDLDANTRLVWI